jgi:hypothetical protein
MSAIGDAFVEEIGRPELAGREKHGGLRCEPFHSQCLKHFIESWLRRRHSPLRWQCPPVHGERSGPMKSTFLAVAVATAALNIFAPAVCHAQNYIVNGHKASKATGSDRRGVREDIR